MFDKPEIGVFDTLFEAVSEAVIIIDTFQKIKTINFSTEKTFGYTVAELLGASIEKIIPMKFIESYENHLITSFLKLVSIT